MTIRETLEIDSWLHLPPLETEPIPRKGDKAPSTSQLVLPCGDGKPAIIAFLRHCGCPFAEKTFLRMREAAESHPDIHFIAVSHSNKQATEKWVEAVGGPGQIGLIVDANRTLYARWGLGVSDWWHVFSPWALWSVVKLGRYEGIKNRATESGSRWQTSGWFVVNGSGVVTWGEAAPGADKIPDFGDAVASLQ